MIFGSSGTDTLAFSKQLLHGAAERLPAEGEVDEAGPGDVDLLH
jgi:hypothetical protein